MNSPYNRLSYLGSYPTLITYSGSDGHDNSILEDDHYGVIKCTTVNFTTSNVSSNVAIPTQEVNIWYRSCCASSNDVVMITRSQSDDPKCIHVYPDEHIYNMVNSKEQ